MQNLVRLLLKNNKIAFDKAELDFQIKSHPSFPSLHAITGVLDHFNITNIAAEVPQNIETLLELPNCFLAQIKTSNGKEIVTVVKKKIDYVIFFSTKEKEKYSETEFLKKFTGIIVAVEKESSEVKQKVNLLNYILTSLLVSLSIFVLVISKPNLLSSLFFLTSLTGVFISISIYKQEIGISSFIGNTFCSGTDDKKDCDAVLSSKGATVFKQYKLSDFSLLYFLVLSISAFFMVLKNSPLDILHFISIIVLPVTLYSIYYQYQIIKKWCFLCLSIVGLLWFQAFLSLFKSSLKLLYSFENILIIGFSFLTILLIWNFLKPRLKEYNENKETKIAYYRFKRNFNLFFTLLNSSKKLVTNLKEVPEIVLGNSSSKLEIVIITNPFCGHCKPLHKQIENILKSFSNEVKIIIRFNVDINDTKSTAVEITTRLLEIYQKEGSQECLKAMDDAYEEFSSVKWQKKWKKTKEKEIYLHILQSEKKWCIDNEINFTPEILISGKSFPKEYDRADLIYFIEELFEECSMNKKI
ncbi:vitamin K epoxide reductase family protein [Tenacibaculum halocynthiae]|uniref:vitamin K epoxide reductase family protein n=1 Tax=Tenacibaculum halocynthiae TaxID=1254437 RepID=UPI003894F828